MGQTFAEKALARAAGLDRAVAGQLVDARPDVALSHDNTAPIARTFREIGAARVRYPDRLAITLDHAVPAPTTQHATNHYEVRRFVAEQGIRHFFEAGRGICHQVLSEEALIWPGQTVLGADSHTTHFGWLGAFGAGVGRSEMAAIWATGELWLRVPDTIRFDMTGRLPAGVTTKDLSLWIMRLIGAEGAIYYALEFGGPAIAELSIASRMVIPNMMAECGAKNAYVTPDEQVYDWLAERAAVRRGEPVAELAARIAAGALFPDADAHYVARHSIDLGRLEPLVACPHSPDNVVLLSEVSGTHVDQAFLGTCTNGRLEDLAAAAAVLRGSDGRVRRVATGTRLLVIPASNEVLQDAIQAGYIQTFLAAGAMLGTPGCGPCMGNHLGIPAPAEVTISSANRNFRGRMGTPESAVYLASPAVVAASAVTGRITDPREITGEAMPARTSGGLWAVTDAATEPVSKPATAQVAVEAGPAGGENVMAGRAWKYGDNVNTDVIFPGKYTYTIHDPAQMALHALEDLDPTFAGAVQPGDIIVAGRNWGCGSSREQAAVCLKMAGINAIIAASFARIFFRNAVNNGVLPIACPEAAAAIQPGERVTVDLERCLIYCGAGTFAFPPLSTSLRRILQAGGLVPMLRASIGANQ